MLTLTFWTDLSFWVWKSNLIITFGASICKTICTIIDFQECRWHHSYSKMDVLIMYTLTYLYVSLRKLQMLKRYPAQADNQYRTALIQKLAGIPFMKLPWCIQKIKLTQQRKIAANSHASTNGWRCCLFYKYVGSRDLWLKWYALNPI